MIQIAPALRAGNRRLVAAARAREAMASLAECHLCAHHCGVNRLAGERGPCGARVDGRIFSIQTEVSDELELIPTFAIALGGCDMRCAFCITGADSWNPSSGVFMTPAEIAIRAEKALAHGARTIMILGGEPTIHLPTALEIVAALPAEVPLIWKTNAHGSAEARDWLEGVFDFWLADYKFGNDACAERLSRTSDYTRVVQENLRWAGSHTQLLVRHLLMPGHVDCCWRPVAQWLAENLPDVRVNLRTGFWPAWQARRHRELGGPVPSGEADRAWEIARELSLTLIE